jgi:hypothetical protein
MKRMTDVFKISAGAERILCFLAFFGLVCHMMACIWIFSADISVDTIVYKDADGKMIDENTDKA